MADTRARLEAVREQARARQDALRRQFDGVVAASLDSNADDEHDPEGATIAYERSQLKALLAHAEQSLNEVDAALDRVAEGRYGVCELCGGPIGAKRLAARPLARACIHCAATMAR